MKQTSKHHTKEREIIKDPYSYYRNLRPYYFSDSKTECSLTKEVFEYQLDKLSADMKQDEFENFTRQLACRLITPNLIPQTGPTGGGDGKTDIETHTISEDVAVHWYVPGGGCRGEDKWAFAISCKNKWREKIRHDVKSIMSTDRPFSKVLFFTNQLVKAKDKTDLYTEFKNAYGVEVEIFDQKWYVQSVFDNKCADIAVEALNLSRTLKPVVTLGPRDLERKKRIDEIEKKILEEGNAEGFDSEYIEDLIESAELSRYVEDPQNVIRGKFERALSEAKKHGSSQQEFEILYQEGWTAFYWFRAPDEMYEKYLALKKYVSEEVNIPRIEKLFNLYNLISGASYQGLFNNPIDMDEECKFFDDLYAELSSKESTHFSALFLHICILEMRMIYGGLEDDELSEYLKAFLSDIKESEHCLDIHISSQVEVFKLLGNVFVDNELYDDVLDEVSAIIAARDSDIVAAGVQYERGVQNFESGQYAASIRHLGQCAVLYQKEESMGELVRTNEFLASASSELDLINCERSYYAKAAALMLHQVSTVGTVDHLLLTTLLQLCFVEIKAGQITSFLKWLQIVDLLAKSCRDFMTEEFMQRRTELDGALAARLLCSDESIGGFDMLPDLLGRAELDFSRDVALYMLGHTELIKENNKRIASEMPEWKETLVSQMPDEFFMFPLQLCTDAGCMKSCVNGCEITITYPMQSVAKTATETILAFIESVLATNQEHSLLLTTPKINISLSVDDDKKMSVTAGVYSSDYHFSLREVDMTYDMLWELLSQFLSLFLSRNAITQNLKEYLEDKQKKEKFIGRLSLIAGYKNDIDNLIGKERQPSLVDWRKDDDKRYTYRRDKPVGVCRGKYVGKQNKVEIDSLIDAHLWDKASWKGIGFIVDPTIGKARVCLCFEDIDAGQKIIEKWARQNESGNLPLRISFIQGINESNPAWYRVLVTSEMKLKSENVTEPRFVQLMARMHTMTPATTSNLDNFKEFYKTGRPLELCAMKIEGKTMVMDQNSLRISLPFRNFIFKNAWEIDDNEIDTTAILSTDKPYIPVEHKKDAPVLRALSRPSRRNIPLDDFKF